MSQLIKRITSKKFTLIAEIGVNYYDIAIQRQISPIDAAKLMCLEAKKAGIHAVKFQSYKAENLAMINSPSYWDTSEEPTTSQRELFSKYDSFGEAEYRDIAKYCKDIDISFLSTAFDCKAADYLYDLMDVYKISSSDLTNIPFIKYQAQKNKPIMLSTGASTLKEIKRAIEAIRENNNQPLILCHCVLEYPTPLSHANLRKITSLGKEFPDCVIGYSDHCKNLANCDVIKSAYILGASVIEKHFTLDKTLKGNDHYHAMDPNDAKRIIEEISSVEVILGNETLSFNESEMPARLNARRSIVAKGDIKAGTQITADMLTFKRPGKGIPPYNLDKVVGRVALTDIDDDQMVLFEYLV